MIFAAGADFRRDALTFDIFITFILAGFVMPGRHIDYFRRTMMRISPRAKKAGMPSLF